MRSSRALLSLLTGLAVVAGSSGLVTVAAAPAAAQAAPAPARLSLEALSNRADLVSGGDVLLAVTVPAPTDLARLRVDVDGRDVTADFELEGDNRVVGLVESLPVGESTVTARLGRGAGASLTVTNHPIEGPVFSGPHLQPWVCTTEQHGLGAPVDEGCNAPAVFEYLYKSTAGGALRAYDPAAPPTDVATITVDGESVPFIVRRERGTMNRGIYAVAGLWDPAATGDERLNWNGKLLYPFGASSGTIHSQGAPSALTNVLVEHALTRGYLVATNTLNTRGHSQNPVVSAESVMMLKEHITEQYGPIRFTLGQGGSGGAIGQQMVANSYPGLLDGIQPSASFPDGTTTGMEVVDCVMLNRYYAANAAQWPAEDRAAVNGHAGPQPCAIWDLAFGGLLNPTVGCGPIDPALIYHPVTNPDGVRCTAQDYEKNIWGVDAEGVANSPVSNVGVQYGLEALLAGEITPAQFADLNAEIGGLDEDAASTPERNEADPFALTTAYRAGQVNDFRYADQVAIIDLRTPENLGIHTDWHSDEVRLRLIEANGHARNHVIWRMDPASAAAVHLQSFLTMDAWLSAIEADDRAVSRERKVRENRPDAAVDACFVGGERNTDPAFCAERFPTFDFPRIAAGGPPTHDVLACQLRPLNRASYGSVTFTDEEWARIVAAFPAGVCDYSRESIGFQPSVPWLTFEDGPGGQPLGAAPVAAALPALPARFRDVPPDSMYAEAVEFLAEHGVTLGFPDGTYGPGRDITRAQMASFLYRAAGEPDFDPPATPPFPDVPVTHEHHHAIAWLAFEGITVGSPGPGGTILFRPEEGVSRGHMAAFLHRWLGEPEVALPARPSFDDVPADHRFFEAVEWLTAEGVAQGFVDGTYGPDRVVTRGQMALFLHRLASVAPTAF